MSDLKISCPGCGQHIAYDAQWAGRQINCPTCQTAMTIPGALAPPPPAPPPPRAPAAPPSRPAGPAAPAPAPRPMPAPVRSQATGGAGKTSGLAITSLVCGLTFCLAPLTSIAGIICGHIARGQIRRDGSLKGAGLALAGLISGYVFTALALAWVVVVFVIGDGLQSALQKAQQKQMELERAAQREAARQRGQDVPSPTSPSTAPPRPRAVAPTARRPGGSQYREPKLEMPEKPVTGKVAGNDFTYEHAILENGWLTIRQGQNFFADAEVKIVLFLKNGDDAEAEGKTYSAPASGGGTTPHLHLAWQENGERKIGSMAGDYTMKLTFGKFENDQVRGSLELETKKAPFITIKGDFIGRVK